MFCSKCGRELNEMETFCPSCGTKAGAAGSGLNVLSGSVGNFFSGFAPLKGRSVTFFAAVICLLISLFLVGETMFVISYKVFSTQQVEIKLFENADFLKLMFIVGYIAAAAIMLLPGLLKKEWEKWNFLPGICMSLAGAVVFVIVLIGANSKMNSEELLNVVNATLKISGNAWFFLIVSALSLILCIKAGRDITFAQDYYRVQAYKEKGLVVEQVKPQQTQPFSQEKIPAWQRVEMEKKRQEK